MKTDLSQNGINTVVHWLKLSLQDILPILSPHTPVVAPVVEPVHGRPEGTLLCLEVPGSGVNIVTKSPIIVQSVTDLKNS